ncbi:luciferase family protein [Paenibacillus terrigena]|uniref:luciferase domain-containing protein n=1 Tax=Paenibacillus terrigena TaxID=369333 RepID=UPI0003767474|nr:luciferase family protein [Paenibacillus terrigena]
MTLSVKQIISEQLLTWSDVTKQPHRFGGIEFLYQGKEIGHFHGDFLVDILMSRPSRDQFIAEGRAKPHHIYPESNWISVYIQSEEDLMNAIELLRFKYNYLVSKME